MNLFSALLGALLSAVLCVSTAGATTYFVSPQGSDFNSGTSTDQAWRTLARIGQASIKGGDAVLLQRGGVWHESMQVQGGSAGSFVVYGAYGSGNMPVIDGADVVSSFQKVAPSTFRAAFSGSVGKVFVGDDLLTGQVPLQQAGSSDDCYAQPGTYFADGDTLLVHTATDFDDSPVVEVSTSGRRYAIENRGETNFIVQDLALVRSYNSAFISRPTATSQGAQSIQGSQIVVQRCRFLNYGSVSEFYNADVAGDAGEGAIYIAGYHDNPQNQEQPLPGIQVLNNDLGRYDSKGTIDYDRAAIYIRNTTGAVIRGNTVNSQTAMGIRVADNYNNSQNDTAVVDSNTLTRNQGNISIAGCSGCSVTGNTIQDSYGFGIGLGRGIFNASDQLQIIGNTIARLRQSTDGTLYNGVDCNAGTTRGVARYNSISAVANYSFTLEADNGQPCSGWTVEENTFDARANVTFQGQPAGRVGCLFVQRMSLNGAVLRNNDLNANSAYPQCVSYGSENTSDTSKDVSPSAMSN